MYFNLDIKHLISLTILVPSPYQVREKRFYYSSHQCVRDWSGILCERDSEAGTGSGGRALSLSK